MEISIGADVELFLTRDNEYLVPPYYVIGNETLPLPYGNVFPDGGALEFTVNVTRVNLANKGDTQNGINAFCYHVMENVNAIRNCYTNYTITNVSAMKVHASDIDAIPITYDEHGNIDGRSKRVCLSIFGCNPDMCVYDDTFVRPSPHTAQYRCIGAHLHVGTKDIDVHRIVMMFDFTVGLLSLAFATEEDKIRRSLYGRAGYFRVKPYGVEYRVLPSRALTGEYTKEIMQVAVNAVKKSANKNPMRIFNDTHIADMIDAINNIHIEKVPSLLEYVDTTYKMNLTDIWGRIQSEARI